MKHAGKAGQAGLKMIGWSLFLVLLILGAGFVAKYLSGLIAWLSSGLIFIWALFALFTFYFFRDPTARVPKDAKAIVSPGHGTVDVIDETDELEFMGGKCKRISIFLSVFDVHVQQAPITGKVAFLRHRPGQFLNAIRADCALHNENVLIGLESDERAGEKVGVCLIAGLIARRIIPWLVPGETVEKGGRISLIQFGSRVNLYLPLDVTISVRLGQKVVGGETIVAMRK
jgi:phosphatidylserine decarboxylase